MTGPPTTSRQPDGAADVVFLDPGVPHAHAAEVQRVLQSCGGALTRILSKDVSAVLYHTPRPTGRALPGPKGFNSQRLLSGGAKAEGTAVPGAVLWGHPHVFPGLVLCVTMTRHRSPVISFSMYDMMP